jgi:transglutaminase-like putative cysteine protease
MSLSYFCPPRATRTMLPLFAVVLLPMLGLATRFTSAQTVAPKIAPPDEWTGIYLGKQKAGYSGTHYSFVTYQGKSALKASTHGITRLKLLGSSVEQEEETETISDLQSRPLTQLFHVKSNGSVIQVAALFDYEHQQVHCTIGEGAAATQKDLPIPAGAKLEGDSNNLVGEEKPVVGQKFVATYLEPLSVELQEATVEVVGQESVREDSGKKVTAFRVNTSMSLGQMTSWVDSAGHAIKSEINLGTLTMVMVRETRARALDRTALSPALTNTPLPTAKRYVPPADFAVATAIATAKPIADPRNLKTLKVVIDGIPSEKLLLSDARQQESRRNSHGAPPYEVAVSVHAESVEEASVPSLPLKDPALAPYLKAAPYLPVDDPQLRKTAAQIRGAETNPYLVAISLRDWVSSAMTPDPTIGVPRSALDIFQRRRGVCRDYATLYTALARAAGVPTRLCSGIVYGDFQGKAGFYYHAWAESWVGKWVAIDPTLFDPSHPVNYVDATHIKFAQGDVTQMFQMVAIVGRLKITVE